MTFVEFSQLEKQMSFICISSGGIFLAIADRKASVHVFAVKSDGSGLGFLKTLHVGVDVEENFADYKR